jgi:GNAT superfamily N-acetyltransferase
MASPVADIAAIAGEIDGELACCQICVTQRVRVGAEVFSRVRSADFAVRPRYQGLGIASELMAFKNETVGKPTLRLTETNAAPIQHLSRKLGARPLGNPLEDLQLPLRWLDPGMPGRGTWRAVRSMLLAPALRVLSLARRRHRDAWSHGVGPAVTVRRTERFDARFGEWWSTASEAFDVVVERTPEYLEWRYCDPRGGRWNVEVAEEGDRVLGFVAWRIERGRGMIGDLIGLADRLDVIAALADAAVSGAVAAGASSVRCWLTTTHPYRAVLHSRGFVDLPAGVTHVFRPQLLSDEAADLLASPAARIHFMLGDSDFL